jgi:hypothetical protein
MVRKFINRLVTLLERMHKSVRASRAELVEGTQHLDRQAR